MLIGRDIHKESDKYFRSGNTVFSKRYGIDARGVSDISDGGTSSVLQRTFASIVCDPVLPLKTHNALEKK
jgi:hypothetical protein